MGTFPLLAITQFAFVVRLFYYSILTDPWYVLPCELLHGFTFAITWSTACAYAHEIAPVTKKATIMVCNII